MNDGGSKQDEIEEAESQLIVSSGDVAIILNTLKKTLDKVALLIEFSIKGVFHLEFGLVRYANCRSAFFEIIMNFVARVSTICENFFALKFDSCKQFKHRFRVVNLSAGQDQFQKLHSFVEEYVNFGVLAAPRRADCLSFKSGTRTLMHFAKRRINLKQRRILGIAIYEFQKSLKQSALAPLTEFVIEAVPVTVTSW